MKMNNPCLVFLLLFPFLQSNLVEAKPLQVFILAGQSNMQGHARVTTFEHIGMDPATQPMLEAMQNPDGTAVGCERVWISALGVGRDENEVKSGKLTTGFGAAQNGPKIGPEFTFGIYMAKFTDAPILLIKTAWGGKSLHTDFRPPGAGTYEFQPSQMAAFKKQGKDVVALQAEKVKETGVYYRRMIDHVRKVLTDPAKVVPDYDEAEGYELSGFVWFQGWNDMVDSGTYPDREMPGGYHSYSEVLTHFIRDVRLELKAPQLPFVIGVLGVGGPVSGYLPDQQRYRTMHQHFREAMAAPADLPEFRGNVVALHTERFWDQELSAARFKDNQITQKIRTQAKAAKLDPGAEKQLIAKERAASLTERETMILEKGVSNLEFHYLGSAKILGGIGKGMAESLQPMLKRP